MDVVRIEVKIRRQRLAVLQLEKNGNIIIVIVIVVIIISSIRRSDLRKVLPPGPKKFSRNDSKPGGPEQVGGRHHHLKQLDVGYPLCVHHFLRVRFQLDVLDLDEEDVIDFMLSPGRSWSVSDNISSPVVQTCKELEVFDRNLRRRNSKLVLKFANGRALDPRHVSSLHFFRPVNFRGLVAKERVGTAGVGPNAWEGNLLLGSLLEEELSLVVEEEHRERAVKFAPRSLRAEDVRLVLVVVTDYLVLHVQ
mmetsp:Transcript_736/g.2196  ORF Transcript_736/g.2196 Transcript_736/m.2196 type:complete len:250 (+) Transcript_736:101-850(+)